MADIKLPGDFTTGTLALAGLAARALGWRPAEFWAATPAELAASLTDPASDAAAPLSRADIDTLLEQDRDGQ